MATDTDWLLVTTPYDIMSSGTEILMGTYPFPTGWTISSSYDDRMVMLTNTTGEIGNTGGSWTITGIDSQGAHNHGGSTGTPSATVRVGGSDIYTRGGSQTHSHSIETQGLHQHTFDGNWRPAYVKFAVAQYT
jgi:hypothetical protein